MKHVENKMHCISRRGYHEDSGVNVSASLSQTPSSHANNQFV